MVHCGWTGPLHCGIWATGLLHLYCGWHEYISQSLLVLLHSKKNDKWTFWLISLEKILINTFSNRNEDSFTVRQWKSLQPSLMSHETWWVASNHWTKIGAAPQINPVTSHGVSTHTQLDCLLNRLLRLTSKKTPKLCITGSLWREPTYDQLLPFTEGQWCGKRFLVMTSSWMAWGSLPWEWKCLDFDRMSVEYHLQDLFFKVSIGLEKSFYQKGSKS